MQKKRKAGGIKYFFNRIYRGRGVCLLLEEFIFDSGGGRRGPFCSNQRKEEDVGKIFRRAAAGKSKSEFHPNLNVSI